MHWPTLLTWPLSKTQSESGLSHYYSYKMNTCITFPTGFRGGWGSGGEAGHLTRHQLLQLACRTILGLNHKLPPVNPCGCLYECVIITWVFFVFYNVTKIKYTKTSMLPSIILPQKHHSFSFPQNLKEQESTSFMCADRPWGKVFRTFAHLHTWKPKSTSKLVPCILNHYSFIIS